MFYISTELHIFAFENPPEQVPLEPFQHPLRLKWGTVGTLPTPKKRHGVPSEHFQHPLRLKWGTIGTLPTLLSIINLFFITFKNNYNYEFGNYFSY